MKLNWRKVPSVTTGGKPFFWVADHAHSVVVWDRPHRKWRAESGGLLLGFFDTAEAGKRVVEQQFAFRRLSL